MVNRDGIPPLDGKRWFWMSKKTYKALVEKRGYNMIKYREVLDSPQVEKVRLRMIRFAEDFGIKAASREFEVDRKTVRK